MKIPWLSIFWSLVTILLAALVAFVVARNVPLEVFGDDHEHSRNHTHSGYTDDFHAWLHDNLEITAEQEVRLLPFEKRFELKKTELQSRIESAGKDLALAIRIQELDSPEVSSAHAALLAAQGDLQRATLEHFFAMKAHLNPEQGEKLLEWTHDSLTHGHTD